MDYEFVTESESCTVFFVLSKNRRVAGFYKTQEIAEDAPERWIWIEHPGLGYIVSDSRVVGPFRSYKAVAKAEFGSPWH